MCTYIFLLDQGGDSPRLLLRSPVGRVALPEPAHVATDVPGDAFVVLEARIPAEAAVAEDPNRWWAAIVLAAVAKFVVIVHVVEVKVVCTGSHGCRTSWHSLLRMVNTRARPIKIFPTFLKSLLAMPCQRVFAKQESRKQ